VVVKRGLNPNRPIRFHRQRAADFRGLKDRRPRGLRHSAHPASGRWRRASVRARMSHGPGGHRLETHRRAVSKRAVQDVAEV